MIQESLIWGSVLVITTFLICTTIMIGWLTDNKRKLSADNIVEIEKAHKNAEVEIAKAKKE